MAFCQIKKKWVDVSITLFIYFFIFIIVIFSSSACGPVLHSLKASGTKASLRLQGKLNLFGVA